jgi:hypothetical protein
MGGAGAAAAAVSAAAVSAAAVTAGTPIRLSRAIVLRRVRTRASPTAPHLCAAATAAAAAEAAQLTRGVPTSPSYATAAGACRRFRAANATVPVVATACTRIMIAFWARCSCSGG